MKHFTALILLVAGLGLYGCAASSPYPASHTQWRISHSVGLDTLAFIGALSGDKLARHHYASEIDDIRGNLSPQSLEALDTLDVAIRQEAKGLVGPSLVLYFSAGKTETIADLIRTTENPEAIKPVFEASPYYHERRWQGFARMAPMLKLLLEDLQRVGFEEMWATEHELRIRSRMAVFEEALTPYDVIPEQERLLGRVLDPTIEIIILNYSQPYGIRIVGQRFISHHSYEPETQLRIAAHEIFHPPFDRNDGELRALMEPLSNDSWMLNIVNDHDPSFGYNSFFGLINEDSTQALDQIVSERLGFAREPSTRFLESDDGMHMFAAALYHAMLEDGFAENGGEFSVWLKSALRRGMLTPQNVRRRAAEIVGPDAVERWNY